MKVRVDEQADAVYIRLNELAVVESEEIRPGVVFDFDANGVVVGVELLGVSRRQGGAPIRSVTVETGPADGPGRAKPAA